MWIKSTSFNVWVRYFVWDFKGTLWNSTQNILPIHWKIWFLCNFEILRALRFKSSWVFLKRPQITHPRNAIAHPYLNFKVDSAKSPLKLGKYEQSRCLFNATCRDFDGFWIPHSVNHSRLFLEQIVRVTGVFPSSGFPFHKGPVMWKPVCIS